MPKVSVHNGRWVRVPNASILAEGSLVRMAGRRTYSSIYLALLSDEPNHTASVYQANDFGKLQFAKLTEENYICTPYPIKWSFSGPVGETFGESEDAYFYTDSGSDWEDNRALNWAMRITPSEVMLYLLSFTDDSVHVTVQSGQTGTIDIRAETTDAAAPYNLVGSQVVDNPRVGRKEYQLRFTRAAGNDAFDTVSAGNPVYIKGIDRFDDLVMVKSHTNPPCDITDASTKIQADDAQRVIIQRAPANSVWAATTDSSNVETLIIEGSFDPN